MTPREQIMFQRAVNALIPRTGEMEQAHYRERVRLLREGMRQLQPSVWEDKLIRLLEDLLSDIDHPYGMDDDSEDGPVITGG